MDLNTTKPWLVILAVAIPILGLAAFTIQKANVVATGVPVKFPISGYDPRDLLAGHYVTYQVDYEIFSLCENESETNTESAPRKSNYESCLCFTDLNTVPPMGYQVDCSEVQSCGLYLRGKCNYNRFEAGIERYYINENAASDIDRIVRQGKSQITVKIDRLGNAVVESLELKE